MPEYRLLTEFRRLFEGKRYLHRASNLGDFVAMHLYEDLAAINRSDKYLLHVTSMSRVLNVQNKRAGIAARRGDGTFGELIPGEPVLRDPGYIVGRGPIATVEIGVEVKILAKAMIKQIDRVKGDLIHQVRHFNEGAGSSNPLCVAVVGVNHASFTTGYEGDRSYRTDGKSNKHPIQEAEQACYHLQTIAHHYDEFLILKYMAANEPPYPFEWADERESVRSYGALLVRLSNEYQSRY